jgi:hypothetical protein
MALSGHAIRRQESAAMLNDASKSSVVLDREVEKEKSRVPSDPRIRCRQCGWTPRKDDRWACECRHLWNTFDTGASDLPNSTSGVRPNASSVAVGRRIRIGMQNDTFVCRIFMAWRGATWNSGLA